MAGPLPFPDALNHWGRYPYLKNPEIKICKLCQHPILFVLKSGIKINPKQNVLSGFKLLSRDSVPHISYEIHVRMFSHATTYGCKQHFETAYHSHDTTCEFITKGGSNANNETSIFDVSHDYVKKLCLKETYFILANVIFLILILTSDCSRNQVRITFHH